jgi:hypothetical protein
MKQGGTTKLDEPPPLPKEATRKAPSSWMNQKQDDSMQMGAAGGSPIIQLLQIRKTIEGGVQQLAAMFPQTANAWMAILAAIDQTAGQSLAGNNPPPGVGAPQGPAMAPPSGMPMPPPPPGAGAPGGMQ